MTGAPLQIAPGCRYTPCQGVHTRRERIGMSRNAKQRLSFYLLVMLTLYASLAGG